MGGKYIIFFVTIILLVAMACTPKVRYGILSKVFDGVPPPESINTMIVGKDTLGQVDSTRILALAAGIRQPQFKFHQPYQNKNCSGCHDEQHFGRLVAEEPQLCYQCHDSKNEKYTYKHGPAGAGYCGSCHRPHMAESKNLLISAGESLCFACHEKGNLLENKIHKNIRKNNCTECHNPHSSENRFMLQKGACYKCHEDKTEDYSFLHGPVSADYCSVCHSSHDSKTENLLVMSGQELCLNCHYSESLKNTKEHIEKQNESCTNCHDPHGGENRYLLN